MLSHAGRAKSVSQRRDPSSHPKQGAEQGREHHLPPRGLQVVAKALGKEGRARWDPTRSYKEPTVNVLNLHSTGKKRQSLSFCKHFPDFSHKKNFPEIISMKRSNRFPFLRPHTEFCKTRRHE